MADKNGKSPTKIAGPCEPETGNKHTDGSKTVECIVTSEFRYTGAMECALRFRLEFRLVFDAASRASHRVAADWAPFLSRSGVTNVRVCIEGCHADFQFSSRNHNTHFYKLCASFFPCAPPREPLRWKAAMHELRGINVKKTRNKETPRARFRNTQKAGNSNPRKSRLIRGKRKKK